MITDDEYKIVNRQEPTYGRSHGLCRPFLKTNLNPFLVLQVVFNEEKTAEQNTILLSPKDITHVSQNLVGYNTVMGKILNDPEDGLPYIFFIFPDILIRVIGKYAFSCYITDLNRPQKPPVTVQTSPFRIVSPEEYIKPTTLTPITKSFIVQGERYSGGIKILKK
ncbi:hypothetical protein HDV06_004721 [Boothiomyces sp. JEL0866]|nr:hypothetical protein HDV06_004721 [Boothiomyces sp. JEL0866]